MARNYSTYLAYGVQVKILSQESAEDLGEVIDHVINRNRIRYPDLGHLWAGGSHDRDMFFLVTEAYRVTVGRVHEVPGVQSAEVSWDRQIAAAITELGWTDRFTSVQPCWFVVPDYS